MTSSISPTAYVPEISEIEGKFFTDIESVLSSMTKPTGKGESEKAALLSDEAAAKYADQLGDVLKAKFFNSNDLVLLKKSFDAEKNSAVFNFDTVLKRAEQFGRDADPAAVAPVETKAADSTAAASNVEVVVNVGGARSGSTPSSSRSESTLSPLANDIIGAIGSMSSKAAGFLKGIQTGDINQYTIGTAARPGAYAKLMADAVAARGIVVNETTSRTDILRASVEALNRLLEIYQMETQDSQEA